jgi:20S proteasome subunit beta 3
MVAMVGKDCVAIASDLRLGVQAQTVAMDFQKVFQMGPKLMVGLPGLATDVLTVCVAMAMAIVAPCGHCCR